MDKINEFQRVICQHYTPDYNIGFKIITPHKGERYEGRRFAHHCIVFMLEGEVIFSYNDFLNRHFKKGDLLFLPQSAEMHGIALEDSKMLILNFNNRVKSLCDNCCIPNHTKELKSVHYDFLPLKLTPTMLMFADLMENYLTTNVKCSYLHELKQKELFVLMGSDYTRAELLELFYPIAGGSIDFRSRVLENFTNEISVFELAQKFGMSYTNFLRKFKAEFGESVQDWMLKQKAKYIKLRLSVPTTTIADIIQEFGFTDASHFTKYCRKQFGCTPTELIKHIRSLSIHS